MARKRMVTRTIKFTKFNVMCLDIETATPYEREVILGGVFKDAKSAKAAIMEVVDDETHRAVHIISSEVKTELYGMTETDFINNAEIIKNVKEDKE